MGLCPATWITIPVAGSAVPYQNRDVAHLPINHPLRGLYRALAALVALYVLAFGAVGLTKTSGTDFFGHPHAYALGLRTNMAFSVLSIVVGAVVLASLVYGRNLDHYVTTAAGVVFLLAGLVMLALVRTSANFLNTTVAATIVSDLLGTTLLTCGLYSRVGRSHEAEEHQADRHRSQEQAPRDAAPLR